MLCYAFSLPMSFQSALYDFLSSTCQLINVPAKFGDFLEDGTFIETFCPKKMKFIIL